MQGGGEACPLPGSWLLGVPATPLEKLVAWLGHGVTGQVRDDDNEDFGSCGLLAGMLGSLPLPAHLSGELHSLLWGADLLRPGPAAPSLAALGCPNQP